MQTKDFKGQDLRGRSFKGQDLTGADFSGCDLRGVDFSGATLFGTKFCNVKMGRTLKYSFILLWFRLILGALAGILATLSNILTALLAKASLELFSINSYKNHFAYMLIYAFLVVIVVVISVNQYRWRYICWFFILTAIMSVGGGIGGLIQSIVITVTVVVAILAAGIGTSGWGGYVSGILIFLINMSGSRMMFQDHNPNHDSVIILAAVVSIFYILLGIYLSSRAIKKEELQLSFLRSLSLKIACSGSTQFAFSTLSGCDFSGADLKYARFKDVKMTGCRFQKAKNHHLALTADTPLKMKQVRELVVNGEIISKDFSFLNIDGLDFSGLDLSGFNFANANISFANFSGCLLNEANLSEVNAIGTCFNHSTMTGACIEHWNIDTRTQLQDIECAYVYLTQDKSQRNPPQGEFKAGEFSKLYQEISNTVDFIAHTPAELQALLRAIEKIKSEGGQIFIQQMERKTDSVVIRVQSESEAQIDKEAIYAEVNKQKEVEMKALEAEWKQRLLEQKVEHLERESQLKDKNQDLLAELTRMALQNKPTIQQNITAAGGNVSTNNKNSQTTITDSNFNNDGVLNLGEINGNVSSQQKTH